VPWLEINRDELQAKVVAMPKREDVQTPAFNEQLIVEFVLEITNPCKGRAFARPVRGEVAGFGRPMNSAARRKEHDVEGFQKPKRLASELESLTEKYGRFSAQPFERGWGTTVGNTLRRALLSSIEAQPSPR